MDATILEDVIRGIHLFCLALGMGTALYLDFRTLVGLDHVVKQHDLSEMARIHMFVSFAFAGLWVSGLTLIWWQTAFDVSQFSPKLWCKLIIVTAMTINAILIARIVMPAVERQVGQRLISMPQNSLIGFAIIASVSAFCWLSALALGSSAMLKKAQWDALSSGLPLVLILTIIGGISVTLGMRWVYVKSKHGQAENRQLTLDF